MSTTRTRTHTETGMSCTPEQRVTKSLLAYGVVAGPFYVMLALAPGVDP